MRRFLPLFLFAALLLPSPSVQAQDSTSSASGEATAFVGVNVIPMDEERVLENQTVIVRDGRIAEMGSADEMDVPEGAMQIEGEGRFLVPGMAEMHGHIPSPEEQPDYTDDVLFLFIANGVTTVRGMQGQPGQLALRERANSGEILSPSLYLAGPAFSGGSIDSPEAAEERVRQQHEEGWDYLKILGGLTPEEYDAMAETAQEVGIPFVGHVPGDVGLMHALEQEQQTIDHVDGYIEYLNGDEGPVNEDSLAHAIERTLEAGTAIIPTMALWETLQGTASLDTLTGYTALQYLPPDMVASWTESHEERLQNPDFDAETAQQVIDNRIRILTALYEGGVPILFGTDAPQQFSVPGFSIFLETERMADAGMTPYDILKSGTSDVGAYFESKDQFGTIEPGARADLILLEANPLEDIARLADQAGVMVRGQWLSAEDIQARLDEIAASYASN